MPRVERQAFTTTAPETHESHTNVQVYARCLSRNAAVLLTQPAMGVSLAVRVLSRSYLPLTCFLCALPHCCALPSPWEPVFEPDPHWRLGKNATFPVSHRPIPPCYPLSVIG